MNSAKPNLNLKVTKHKFCIKYNLIIIVKITLRYLENTINIVD